MVLFDMPMPDRCGNCPLMRCSRCIATLKNIMEYQSNGTKPDWCPFKKELHTQDAEKIIKVLKTEKKCVERQEIPFGCSHVCNKCDLLLPTEDVIGAYEISIDLAKSLIRGNKE